MRHRPIPPGKLQPSSISKVNNQEMTMKSYFLHEIAGQVQNVPDCICWKAAFTAPFAFTKGCNWKLTCATFRLIDKVGFTTIKQKVICRHLELEYCSQIRKLSVLPNQIPNILHTVSHVHSQLWRSCFHGLISWNGQSATPPRPRSALAVCIVNSRLFLLKSLKKLAVHSDSLDRLSAFKV